MKLKTLLLAAALVGVGWWLMPDQNEFDYWRKIQNSCDWAKFERYLRKYEQGEFACTYRRLAEVGPPSPPCPPGGKR